MVKPGDDFDDLGEDGPSGPLLPPEDRLWRHPSELSRSAGVIPPGEELPAEQLLDARRRWLSNTPSRAGAGAAGLVGAVLAAGVVLIGVHLTAWLTPGKSHSPLAAGLTSRVGTTTTIPSVAAGGLAGFIGSVNRAIVKVRAAFGSDPVISNGIVLSQNGYVLVSSAAVAGATGVSVMVSEKEEFPAKIVGIDKPTGLAVLHVSANDMSWLAFSTSRQLPVRSFLLSAWKQPSFKMQLVNLSASPKTTSIGSGPALMQLCPRSLHLDKAPDGAALIDSTGEVIGFVTGHKDGHAIAAPGWLAVRVAGDLIADGHVRHGWLGIVGETTRLSSHVVQRIEKTTPGIVGGSSGDGGAAVRILSVRPGGAAAKAGLHSGDVIEAVDGEAVHNMASLQALLYLMTPSSSVDIEVVRGNELSEMSVRLQAAA